MTNKDAIKWLGNLRNDLGNLHYECLWPYAQAIDEICELLEEQEPVKPIRLENWWECPSCNGNIVANMKYCPGCGRKVKWDG